MGKHLGGRRFREGYIHCGKCIKFKHPTEYYPSCIKKKYWICKDCFKELRKKQCPNINRFFSNMYSHQKKSGVPVNYTWEEVAKYLTRDKKFMKLFSDWVTFDCDKNLTPAIIRKDIKGPFGLNNIIAVTAKEARCKNMAKKARHVIQYNLEGVELARFPNARVASLILNIQHTNVLLACKGKRHTCGGFKWGFT